MPVFVGADRFFLKLLLLVVLMFPFGSLLINIPLFIDQRKSYSQNVSFDCVFPMLKYSSNRNKGKLVL